MTYIPVGTYLTYTAQVIPYLTKGYTDWQSLSIALKNDLPNLPGMEELDVEASNGSSSVLSFSGQFSISIQVLNNGVDHSSETDIQAIIDGTIMSYGNSVISSSITQIQLPNNPGQSPSIINTGATANAVAPSTPSSGNILSSLLPSGSSVSSVLGTSGLITGGTILLIVAIFALILLLPSGFGKALRAVR